MNSRGTMDEMAFYRIVLPALRGATYDVPRGYGHARYEIVGDHSDWKRVRVAQKVYFRWQRGRRIEFVPPTDEPGVLCIAARRLGGYSGPAMESLEMVIYRTCARLEQVKLIPV